MTDRTTTDGYEERIAYVQSTLVALNQLVDGPDCRFLRYLIEMAIMEAGQLSRPPASDDPPAKAQGRD